MNASEMYASKYLNATDLVNSQVATEIQEITASEVGNQNSEKRIKLVAQFKDIKKPMILNKTNALVLAQRYGDNTDGWKNKPIVLIKAFVAFNGKMVESIRIG